MRILFVAAEASPLAKVGGLADVIGSLPKALIDLGHDVRIIMPKYGSIDISKMQVMEVMKNYDVPEFGDAISVNVSQSIINDKVPVYLIENDRYFADGQVYGPNELDKFLFFSRAVISILKELDWQPQIVHCHDWHTALVVMWLKKMDLPYSTVFTIHNFSFKGWFNEGFLNEHNLQEEWSDFPPDFPKPPLDFLHQGIIYADLLTTVSENYARELLTPANSESLDEILSLRRSSFFGIVNGIDYDEYNPRTDHYLLENYGYQNAEKRIDNKVALKKRADLAGSTDIPLIGFVQRLDDQKGIDILEESIDSIVGQIGAQLIILGMGKERFQDSLRLIARKYPQSIYVSIDFDDPLAHLIYGACDMYLLPSRFEPCGLGQLIAMRYGALPIVRHVGGLVDTVPAFNKELTEGNGFVFHEFSSDALVEAIRDAVQEYSNKVKWYKAVKRVMNLDFSWKRSALRYENIYKRLSKRSQ